MNRRGFLMGAGGILALAAAPAIVRADSLMRIIPRDAPLLFRAAFPSPTFSGILVINEAAWSTDGVNWTRVEGESFTIPAGTLTKDGALHLRSLVGYDASPGAKTVRIACPCHR